LFQEAVRQAVIKHKPLQQRFSKIFILEAQNRKGLGGIKTESDRQQIGTSWSMKPFTSARGSRSAVIHGQISFKLGEGGPFGCRCRFVKV
jgi:hypothetical protein